MQKKTIRDIDVNGKRVLLRVDYNVPMENGRITDDTRIRATLPTINYLLKEKARVVLCTHLGRPGGKIVDELRLTPIAERLAGLITKTGVIYIQESSGEHAAATISALQPGGLALLENIRFEPGEEKNDLEFTKSLANMADIFVNDALATAHRAHSSTAGLANFLPAVAGFLMEQELHMLNMILNSPEKPLAAILGGAKVSDKIGVINKLLDIAEVIIIGGGMAGTFSKALGHEIGDSLIEDDWVAFAKNLIYESNNKGVQLLLPSDFVVADKFTSDANSQIVASNSISSGWRIMDIGPETSKIYEDTVTKCKTIVWNGPMGVFEFDKFKTGTINLANNLSTLDQATTVLGGGSTGEAVRELGLEDKMTHVSTGGGATLEFLEGKELPGVISLLDTD